MDAPKVFGIGFQKTGTSSLAEALEILGYRTNHGVFINHAEKRRSLWIAPPLTNDKVAAQALPLAAQYDALTDNPWPVLYRELDSAFPGAKFILTTRDPKSWIQSLVQHFGDRRPSLVQWIYGAENPRGHESLCAAVYVAHNAAVREYFSRRPDDFLELDFARGDGWQELCGFLERPIPDRPFPHGNTALEREKHSSSDWRRFRRPATPLPDHTILQLRATEPSSDSRLARGFWRKLLRVGGSLSFTRQIAAAYFALVDPATPLWVKAALAVALAYFVMPLDVFPDFVAGIGLLDDAAVLTVGMAVASQYVGQPHRARAAAALGVAAGTA